MKQLFLIVNIYLLSKGIITSAKLLEVWRKLKSRDFDSLYNEEDYHEFVHKCVVQRKNFPPLVMEFIIGTPIWINDAIFYYEQLRGNQVKIMSFWDDNFPLQLKQVSDPPVVLFLIGNEQLLQYTSRLIAFVGTRNVTAYGHKLTRRVIWEASISGVIPVSGFANGVDKLVFEYAIKYKIPTIAVLPMLETFKPQENVLYISEYPPHTTSPQKWHFVERNRLIAALSTATVVIEAPATSGALITAQLANDYGRDVYFMTHSLENFLGIGGITQTIVNDNAKLIFSLVQVLFNIDINVSTLFFRNFLAHLYVLLGEEKLHTVDLFTHIFFDLSKFLNKLLLRNSESFFKSVIELKRIGFIKEYKSKLVHNLLYAPEPWLKTS